MKIELPDEANENVISIETSVKYRWQEGYCEHLNVFVDEELAELICRNCDAKINPIKWILNLAGRWYHIDHLYRTYKIAKELYDEKKRTKCRHCGRMTDINAPSDFDRKLQERRDRV